MSMGCIGKRRSSTAVDNCYNGSFDSMEKKMRLTLGKKLGAGFGVILALMVFSSLMTYFKSSNIQESEGHTMSLRVPTINPLTDLQRDLNQTQSKGRQAILAAADP